jgi:hypothetical protein
MSGLLEKSRVTRVNRHYLSAGLRLNIRQRAAETAKSGIVSTIKANRAGPDEENVHFDGTHDLNVGELWQSANEMSPFSGIAPEMIMLNWPMNAHRWARGFIKHDHHREQCVLAGEARTRSE